MLLINCFSSDFPSDNVSRLAKYFWAGYTVTVINTAVKYSITEMKGQGFCLAVA